MTHHDDSDVISVPPSATAPKCGSCGRERTLGGMDAYDYNPIQALTGKPFGWYSGDDGQVCPEDMEKLLR